MDRALINVPYTARLTVYAGSNAADPTPDTATIEVVRADGTNVVPAGTATINDVDPGVFAFNFTNVHMSQLDLLELRWTVTAGGLPATFRTYVEVAGGSFCSLAAMKTVFSASTDDELAALRASAEQRIEKACGRAFVPRFAVETHALSRSRVRLWWPDVRRVRFVRTTTRQLSQTQLDNLLVVASGRILGLSSSGGCGGVVTIGYEYGWDFPPEEVREATPALAQQASTVSSDPNEARIIRREADNQVVAYATPSNITTSTSSAVTSPVLAALVQAYGRVMVA
jgi:hypothetical protein